MTHDQRKKKVVVTDEARQQTLELINRFCAVYDEVFKNRDNKNYDAATMLPRLDALQELNPEFYTAFNYRREILLHDWESRQLHESQKEGQQHRTEDPNAEADEGGATREERADAMTVVADPEALEREIALNTKVIKRDYKVYSAWLHRRWIYSHLPPQVKTKFLQAEKKQCEGLLSLDERNFHAWGYRRWLINELYEAHPLSSSTFALSSSSRDDDGNNSSNGIASFKSFEKDELNFTQAKIEKSFSNYSAWHSRGLIMYMRYQGIMRASVAVTEATKRQQQQDNINAFLDQVQLDLSLAKQAFYCDPDDQSAWLYAERLLNYLRRAAPQATGLLQQQSSSTRGNGNIPSIDKLVTDLHAEVEDACKELRNEALQGDGVSPTTSGLKWPTWMLLSIERAAEEGDAATKTTYIKDLLTADPQRRGYYETLLK